MNSNKNINQNQINNKLINYQNSDQNLKDSIKINIDPQELERIEKSRNLNKNSKNQNFTQDSSNE